MTTGTPLYLVSACGSAEEFVAAFRRYADRTGLFVPSAAPLPAGRRGRLAVTLKDGGVMIEGEAEILQSSVKPTVLHGRPGMTVKFVEPDEPSKIVIGELEKARLALKPAPPSVGPRPAAIPDSPRPVPPAPSGRIDATNALAECVVIGDVSSLRETATLPRGLGGSVNDRSASKFVVPAIPAIGGPRAKTPSTAPSPSAPAPAATTPSPAATAPSSTGTSTHAKPAATAPAQPTTPAPAAAPAPTVTSTPAGTSAPAVTPAPATSIADKATPAKTPSTADKSASTRMTSLGIPVIEKPPAKTESGRVSNATTLGMPALDRKPEPVPARTEAAATPPTTPPAPAGTNPHEEPTAIGETPVKRTTDPTIQATPILDTAPDDEATAIGVAPAKTTPESMPAATPDAPRAEPLGIRRSELAKNHKATSIGFPVVRTPFQTQPLGIVPPASPSALTDASGDPSAPTLPKAGAKPAPAPRGKPPTTPPLGPRHPTPVAPVPIVRPPAKAAPTAAADEESTDIASGPAVSATLDAVANEPEPAPVEQKAQRSGGMRASEILAAIPAGDWTMTPDESMPHPLPPEAKLPAPTAAEPTPAPAPPPKPPPTGDWTMSVDPNKGWSEPEKVERPGAAAATSGNPVVAVASDKPIDVVQWEDKPTSAGESKIEIDSALMAASSSSPDTDARPDAPAADARRPPPPPLSPMPPQPPTFAALDAGRPMTPYPVSLAYGGTTVSASAQRKKMIAMAIGAGAVAVGAIVILVLTLSGGKQTSQANTRPAPAQPSVAPRPETHATPETPAPSTQTAVDPTGVGREHPEAATQPGETPPSPANGACTVLVSSIPNGAEVYLGDQKLGTTPGEIQLPCGTKASLSLRRARYANTLRAFTPVADKENKLVVRLERNQFSVKVTSSPAGATIKVGRKTLGVTPTTIKLPAYDPSTLTLTKPGYAPTKARVTPRRNNASQHVTLKKGRR